jgi:hypothetical protein
MNPITPEILTGFFHTLQHYYGKPGPARAATIQAQVRRFGYLPYSYQRALRELSAADALAGLAEKFRQNQGFEQGQFRFTELSAVRRAGFRDARWLQREQHLLKLTNLLALGERQPGEHARFEDWLKYLLVLPAGNLAADVLATTIYVLPFQERDLGSAYIPHGSAVSTLLADQNLPGLDAEEQVRYFLAFCQLAGHPLMYDVLPQTGRFSRLVLAKPYLARWFDLAALNTALRQAIERLAAEWQPRLPNGVAAALTALELDRFNGLQRPALIVDGDESFTPCGIAESIAAEITLRRADDETFFQRFDALNRFALLHPALLYGQAELLVWEGRQHPVVWLVSASQVPATEKLLVIANSQYPEWIGAQDGVFVHRIGNTMNGVEIWLPRGLQAQAEYVYDSSSHAFEPRQWDTPTPMLFFESLAPAEFHFYRVRQDEG